MWVSMALSDLKIGTTRPKMVQRPSKTEVTHLDSNSIHAIHDWSCTGAEPEEPPMVRAGSALESSPKAGPSQGSWSWWVGKVGVSLKQLAEFFRAPRSKGFSKKNKLL